MFVIIVRNNNINNNYLMSLLLICTLLCVLHITTVTASTNATKIGFHKSCNLGKLGDQYQVDKMDRCHRYQQFYCDLLLPYRKHHFSLLEIGMGCGHHTSCPKSPIMWKTFLPHVEYYGIDFLKDPKKTPEDCIARLKREYPDIPTEGRMFFGSQRDNVFLDQVLKATNIKFDVIIDDASHDADDETNSFIKLWPYVAEGGLFIIEDLQVGRKGFPKWAESWSYLLGGGLATGRTAHELAVSDYEGNKKKVPTGLASLGCSFQICYFRKAYSGEDVLPDDACVFS